MKQPGMRAGAILSADAATVQLLGYGTYDGDLEHPEMGIPNPHITLDDGSVVWGCECWWGPEEKIKAIIGNRKVEIVTMADSRSSNPS